MSLTDIEKVKLELGLNSFDDTYITDDEIQYFIDKNHGSIRRASLDTAKTLLFMLSQFTHSKTEAEIEIWGGAFFEQYMKALKMYINDPNYSIAGTSAMPYAGGIKKDDIRANIENTNNNVVNVESGVPTDDKPNQDPFNKTNYASTFFEV